MADSTTSHGGSGGGGGGGGAGGGGAGGGGRGQNNNNAGRGRGGRGRGNRGRGNPGRGGAHHNNNSGDNTGAGAGAGNATTMDAPPGIGVPPMRTAPHGGGRGDTANQTGRGRAGAGAGRGRGAGRSAAAAAAAAATASSAQQQRQPANLGAAAGKKHQQQEPHQQQTQNNNRQRKSASAAEAKRKAEAELEAKKRAEAEAAAKAKADAEAKAEAEAAAAAAAAAAAKEKERAEARRLLELRAKLRAVASQSRPTNDELKSLDASIKKNAAIVKKLSASFSEEAAQTIVSDIGKTNQGKYVSECVQALLDAPLKPKDALPIVIVAVAMHARYAEFLSSFVDGMAALTAPPATPSAVVIKQAQVQAAKDPTEAAAACAAAIAAATAEGVRRRGALRVLGELLLIGAVEPKAVYAPFRACAEAASAVGRLASTTALASTDGTTQPISNPKLVEAKEAAMQCLLSVANFAKAFRVEIFGTESSHGDDGADSETLSPLPDDERRVFCDVANDALVQALGILAPMQEALFAAELAACQSINTKGEMGDALSADVARKRKEADAVAKPVGLLAESLGVDLPKCAGIMPTFHSTLTGTRLNTFASTSSVEGWSMERLAKGLAPIPKDQLAAEAAEDAAAVAAAEAAEAEALAKAQIASPWGADDETKKFYTEIFDLRGRVPATLLEGGSDGGGADGGADNSASSSGTQEKDGKDGKKSGGDAVDAHFNKLCNVNSPSGVDKWCIDFCKLGYSKGNRRRFVRFVVTGPSNRKLLESENIAYFARAAAILSGAFKDIGEPLAAFVEEDLGVLHARKGTLEHHLLPRLRNAKLMGELVKFGIAPAQSAFSSIRILLEDFGGHAVDVTCALLESCGQYLYRTPETHVRMKNSIDVFWRLVCSKAAGLGDRQTALVENAYYGTKAADESFRRIVPSTAKRRKPKPTLLLYVRWLFDTQLARPKGVARVVKQLRKLPWDDEPWIGKDDAQTSHTDLSAKAMAVSSVLRCVHKGCGGSSEQIARVASFVGSFNKVRPDFRVLVIDDLLEEIAVGLANNATEPKHQKRVAHVRLLAELFNARLVEADVITSVLKFLLNPPEQYITDEAMVDCFRIRLVCALLGGSHRGIGRNAKGRLFLDEFMRFFQRFILWKSDGIASMYSPPPPPKEQLSSIVEEDGEEEERESEAQDVAKPKAPDSRANANVRASSLPMDVEFEVDDIFHSLGNRLKFRRAKTFYEAQQAVEQLVGSTEVAATADAGGGEDDDVVIQEEDSGAMAVMDDGNVDVDDDDDDDDDDDEQAAAKDTKQGVTNAFDDVDDDDDDDDDYDDDDDDYDDDSEEDDDDDDESEDDESDDDDSEDDVSDSDDEMGDEAHAARAAEDAFARELATLTLSGNDTRRGMFDMTMDADDIGAPPAAAPKPSAANVAASSSNDEPKVAFKVMAGGQRGAAGKFRNREVLIPADVSLARRRLDAQEADEAERRALKAAILRNVDEQNAEEAEAAAANQRRKFRWVG
ncbi:regulator of nonsense transcription UPF2 [Pycnococcus provasolii]